MLYEKVGNQGTFNPSMEYFLIWHKSDEGDGGHIWMKELIINAFIEAKK